MKEGRNHTQEAIDKIRAELLRKPGQSREKLLARTGTGIPEFQSAQEALGLVCRKTEGGKTYGTLIWSLPTTRAAVDRVCVMQSMPYVERHACAPRAGSLAYQSIKSFGMPT